MSYAESLLATYPPSYGPSTLLSDDLVTRSNFNNFYPSTIPYISNARLLSDDLAFNQLNYDTTNYHPTLYSLTNSNSTLAYPTTNYQKTLVKNQRKTMIPYDSFGSFNDITEYSDSLATASNTTTASSIARPTNDNNKKEPMNMFYQQSYDRMSGNTDDSSQLQPPHWAPPQIKQKGQSDKKQTKSKTQNQLSTTIHKSSADKLNDDITPLQSPRSPMTLQKQQSYLERNETITDVTQPSPSIDIQAWVNGGKKESSMDEVAAEQAWSVKIGNLYQVQAQREKDKAKASRALPAVSKKADNKSTTNKTKSTSNATYASHDSYLDSLFDGDFFRKPLPTDYILNTSYQQPILKKNNAMTNSYNDLTSYNLSKNSKNAPQRKAPRYEPPSTKRAPPVITTTTRRTQNPTYPNYLHNEFNHYKDTDERFREALHKIRQDRAEQQQKEINEKTAKRLHYGDYVRHSTKDALLQNAVKPSAWSDFMDLKKGNLYSIVKEEKRQRYNQSKSYGERVRFRNFALHHGGEVVRTQRNSVPLIDDTQEAGSDNNVVPRHNRSKSVSRSSKRPDSGSTNKSHTKQTNSRIGGGGNRIIPNQTSRTNVRTNRRSDDEYENLSDYDTNRKSKQKTKKKNVRYAKFDSSGRVTSGPEDSENELDNHNKKTMRAKNRDINDDLFTVREEKTAESIEGSRYKKR